MSLPASREQWLIARKEPLAREKELTRLRDALNTRRRELPMVKVDKDYVFEGPDGQVSLLELFGPSRQLIVQHVMYDPAWDDACPSCTADLDELSAADFHVSLDATVAPIMFNYRDEAELKEAGLGWALDGPSEQPGMSCFLRDGTGVFHTYSTFGRGMEQGGGPYAVLDLTALGRQEEWEEPKGRYEAPRQAIPDFAE